MLEEHRQISKEIAETIIKEFCDESFVISTKSDDNK